MRIYHHQGDGVGLLADYCVGVAVGGGGSVAVGAVVLVGVTGVLVGGGNGVLVGDGTFVGGLLVLVGVGAGG